MVFEREQLKDKNIFFSDTREVPLRIEVSDREIKVDKRDGGVIRYIQV